MDQNAAKLAAAQHALKFVEPGMIVGLGSGSTATLFIRLLGEQVKQGLQIKGIASSDDSEACDAMDTLCDDTLAPSD